MNLIDRIKYQIEKWKKEIKSITLFQAIRLCICGFVTFIAFRYLLRYLFVKITTETMLGVYNMQLLFNEINITKETSNIITNAYADAYLYQVVFYYWVMITCLFVMWKWFGLPDKILKIKK